MNRTELWIYRITTGLFSLMLVGGALMYIFNNAAVQENFMALGYPTFLIYPMAIAKLLGVVAIVSRKSTMLTEWAYAGFTVNLSLAVMSHLAVGDGEFPGALIALILMGVSYFYYRKLYPPFAAA